MKILGLLARLQVPPGLSLAESFLFVEAGRARAARRREIVEVELPALSLAPPSDADEAVAERLDRLSAEVESRLAGLGVTVADLDVAQEPEAARRAAEAARRKATILEEERQAAEKELAQRAFEGGGTARETEEQLAVAEAARERAVLFRDALDVAREVLASAATTTYGDFRCGLARASREILAACRLPYESLEFGEDLSVTVVARGGRPVTRADLAASVSTGAREQLHLVARLAVAPAPRDGYRKGFRSSWTTRSSGRTTNASAACSAFSSRISSSSGRPSSCRATRSDTSAGWRRCRPRWRPASAGSGCRGAVARSRPGCRRRSRIDAAAGRRIDSPPWPGRAGPIPVGGQGLQEATVSSSGPVRLRRLRFVKRPTGWRLAVTLVVLIGSVAAYVYRGREALKKNPTAPPNPAIGDVLKNGLKLGLDLRGGIHLVMQVKAEDALRAEASDAAEHLKTEAGKRGVAIGTVNPATGEGFTITMGEGVSPAAVSDLVKSALSPTDWAVGPERPRDARHVPRARRGWRSRPRPSARPSRRSGTASTPSASPSRRSSRRGMTGSSSSSPASTTRPASRTSSGRPASSS